RRKLWVRFFGCLLEGIHRRVALWGPLLFAALLEIISVAKVAALVSFGKTPPPPSSHASSPPRTEPLSGTMSSIVRTPSRRGGGSPGL
ncbi:MAG TPA: hypothetical protein VE225_05630, partial [Rubrobacteraceae bacterium]|nr:hypothetical protein [Rubrobacteraceae bacterium]